MAGDMSKITIEEENLTSEEALARVSMILAKSENPKLLSHLSHDEINQLAPLQTVADFKKLKHIQEFTHNFLQFRVSMERLGRREMLDIAGGVKHEPEKVRGIRKLFGGLAR